MQKSLVVGPSALPVHLVCACAVATGAFGYVVTTSHSCTLKFVQ
jgi:hypothetical protein